MSSIPVIEAVHELRRKLKIELRPAISRVIGLLATGQLPPARGRIHGYATKIDQRWWWAASLNYPESSATFNLIDDNKPKLVRATDLALDRDAWVRLLPELSQELAIEEWAVHRSRPAFPPDLPAEAQRMERPSDLIPLGIVHNDDRRAAVMVVVEREWHKGAIELWGFEGRRGAELKPVPLGHELNWVGGPDREAAHPSFIGLAYYCDVTAEPRSAAKGMAWFEIRISKAGLDLIRANLRPEWPAGRKTISFREVAKVIEPFLPAAPTLERRAATGQPVQFDPGPAKAIVSAINQVQELPKLLSNLARSLGVSTFHPTLASASASRTRIGTLIEKDLTR